MNPRTLSGSAVFKTAPLSRSGNPPYRTPAGVLLCVDRPAVYIHDKFLDLLHVWILGKARIALGVIKPSFIVRHKFEELRAIRAVLFLESTSTNVEQELTVLAAIGVDLTGLQNIKTHHIQTNQVHCVLVQMCAVLLVVPVVQLVIAGDNRGQRVQERRKLPCRIAVDMNIAENFLVDVVSCAVSDEQLDAAFFKTGIPITEGLQRSLDGSENVLLPLLRRKLVSRKGVLQSAELLRCIAAKGVRRSERERNSPLFWIICLPTSLSRR